MSLLSKRTFRKWAQVLTERGLTVEDADVAAEIGNAVYIKGNQAFLTSSQSVVVDVDTVSFTVGAVWLNGTTYTYPDYLPGSTITLPYEQSTSSDWLVYCFVPYVAATDYRPSTPVDAMEPEIVSWQVIRVDPIGDVALEIINESDVTPEYEQTPSIVDSGDGSCSTGWVRRQLIRLTPSGVSGQPYIATVIEDPSDLIVFNIVSLVVDNQIAVTGTGAIF